jgi:hypothetical protein
MPEIECTNCGWQGYIADLLCTDEDVFSSKLLDEVVFNICPDCRSVKSYEPYED